MLRLLCIATAALTLASCWVQRSSRAVGAGARYTVEPDWSQPLSTPFVDIFDALPNGSLLVGELGWSYEKAEQQLGDLLLLDLASGAVRWRVGRKPLPARGSVVGVSNDILVTQTSEATGTSWTARSMTNGEQRWTLERNEPTAAMLLDGAPPLLLLSSASRLAATELTQGRELWHLDVAGNTARSVVNVIRIDNAICAAGAIVACVDYATGRVAWTARLPGSAQATALRYNAGTLIVGSDTAVYGFAIATGALTWKQAGLSRNFVDVIPINDVTYASWADDAVESMRIQAIESRSGKALWSSQDLPLPKSAITATVDTLFMTSSLRAFAIDARDGKVRASVRLPLELLEDNRGPDALVATADGIIVTTEKGAAAFDGSLQLRTLASLGLVDTWATAQSGAQLYASDESPVVSAGTVARPPSADTSSPGVALAQARIAAAYAETRVVATSGSPDAKIAAAAYRRDVIASSISSARASIQLGRTQAALNVANAAASGAAGVMTAVAQENKRVERTRQVLRRYAAYAADLRLEGTPPGYALSASAYQLVVYDPTRNAIANIRHSQEKSREWRHIAVLTPDGSRVVGAHVGRTVRADQPISAELKRPPLDVESFSLGNAPWLPAPQAPSNEEQPLIRDVRDKRVTSLRERLQLPECYGNSGADVDFKAVFFAALAHDNVDVIRELVSEGAWVGNSAMAIDFGAKRSAAVLREHTLALRAQAQLNAAVVTKDAAAVRAALSAGANVNGLVSSRAPQISCSDVPLALDTTDAIRQLLLDRGAAINQRNIAGQTPLDVRNSRQDSAGAAFLGARGAKAATP